jgi:AhpD family alkylhydroperoxidase
MVFEPQATLDDFSQHMLDIQQTVPELYAALMREKSAVMQDGAIPVKTKWLLCLVASVAQKCPVCISRAVQHCLEQGYTKEELLEACMVAVLVCGSSAMTYVAQVDKAINALTK